MTHRPVWDTPQFQNQRLAALAETNPLFGPRKLKLGSFCSNVSNAGTMSSMEGVYRLSWDNVTHVARLADEMAFEAIVPIARWRGFGGVTDFNGETYEPLTFAAAVSAQTRNPAVFATSHVPSLHPVMAAKQATTIDHVSGGRFALNVVTGWNRREIELFGSPLLAHDQRFVVAEEWISLMKTLWTSEEPVDFDGRYFQVRGALLKPRPIQPYPALMNASSSPVGKDFAAKHFDILFASLRERDLDSIRAQVQAIRQHAYAEYGRDLKVWVSAYMIIGDTSADAQRQLEHCLAHGDMEALDHMTTEMGITSEGRNSPQLVAQRQHLMAGYAGYQLLGTPAEIVEQMRGLCDAGLDGMLINWPAYISGMTRFQAEVHPLLVEAGLR